MIIFGAKNLQRYILNEESTKDKKVERKSKVKITVGKKIFEV